MPAVHIGRPGQRRCSASEGSGTSPVVTRPGLHGVNDAGCFVCGSCARSFPTVIGRSQHERHKHPAEYHVARVMSDNHRKSSWTDEEVALVATEEIRLTDQQQRASPNLLKLTAEMGICPPA